MLPPPVHAGEEAARELVRTSIEYGRGGERERKGPSGPFLEKPASHDARDGRSLGQL